MKRIKEYKKLFKVEGPIDLKDLKKASRKIKTILGLSDNTIINLENDFIISFATT